MRKSSSTGAQVEVTIEARYLNRELSLLDFQERVLGLAESETRPLLERVKFVAIVSGNLDEFFQVRIAGLVEQQIANVTKTSADGLTPRQQVVAARERILEMNARVDALWAKELLPDLDNEGIRLVEYTSVDPADREYLDDVFEREVFPVLTPLAVDPAHPFPFISDLSLNLAVLLHGSDDNGGLQFARVKIPQNVPRFVPLPDGSRWIPLEQLVGWHLDRLFGGQNVVDYFEFRVTRSADLAVEEVEADDLLEAMESVLRYRQRAAQAVRLEVRAGIPENVLQVLLSGLELDKSAVYPRETPLGLAELWQLYGIDRPDLKDEPFTPTTQPRLTDTTGREVDFFRELQQGDILVHHPYESFATSTGAFLAQAAADPHVLAIKQTLYRTSVPDDLAIGGEEAIVRTLIDAAEAGKQVVVLVELKARFDEAANIRWAKMLEAAGVHVVYGVRDLKTHCKTLLVVRKEANGIVRYAHIGTGNYNPKTARLYEDFGLLTADPDIGADLSELFNHLTGYAMPSGYAKLLVAPTTLRREFLAHIRGQAALGHDGRILFKHNHLVDIEVIDELYAASQAGCRIDLIVRGMCCLRAGVTGLSENITVRSIVGRYLEHSRIFRFGHPGEDAVYLIGSADLMPRNLNRRVEALVPVDDPRLKARLEQVLEVELSDDALAWAMNSDGTWTKVPNLENRDAQSILEKLAKERAKGEVPVPQNP
jgi:polyphosphate kinase